jgi:uncharacterized membrane protein
MSGSATIGVPETAARDSTVRVGQAPRDEGKVTTAVVTINKPAQDVYDFWRDFSNLAHVMENIERIDVLDRDRSHWVVKAPGGRTVEWEAMVTEDVPGQVIGWQTVEGADVRSSGRVEFHDAGARGTVVRALIAFDPPGGILADLLAKLFQREPSVQARRDLRRLKQWLEAGEISTSARTREAATDLPSGPQA